MYIYNYTTHNIVAIFKLTIKLAQLDHLEQANIQNGLRWLERHRNKGDVFREKLFVGV